jgi:hypothetical protein
MPKKQPTAARLRELLDYDPATGIFKWKKRPCIRSCVRPGDEAGFTGPRGYSVIQIDGCQIMSHRLAWLHFYGSFPRDTVDHIDRNKSNNAISNLREASISEQRGNLSPSKTQTDGFRGIYWDPKRKSWQARQAKRFLGRFREMHDAVRAFDEAAKLYYGSFYTPQLPPK